jgi:hypothetical protein
MYDKFQAKTLVSGLRPIGKLHVDSACFSLCQKFSAALFAFLVRGKASKLDAGAGVTSYLALPLRAGSSETMHLAPNEPASGNAASEAGWAADAERVLQSPAWDILDQQAMEKMVRLDSEDPATWDALGPEKLDKVAGSVVVTRHNMQRYIVRKVPTSPATCTERSL